MKPLNMIIITYHNKFDFMFSNESMPKWCKLIGKNPGTNGHTVNKHEVVLREQTSIYKILKA